jgi:hypothetical protein
LPRRSLAIKGDKSERKGREREREREREKERERPGEWIAQLQCNYQKVKGREIIVGPTPQTGGACCQGLRAQEMAAIVTLRAFFLFQPVFVPLSVASLI